MGLADSLLFAPGDRFYCSNTDFLLLGKVIEKVTGERLSTVYRQRILRPLGLEDTSWPGSRTALPAPYPRGFTLQGDTATPSRPADATHWNPSSAGAACAPVSDLADLLTYGRALGTGLGLLPPRAQAQRLRSFPRPVRLRPGPGMRGRVVRAQRGDPRLQHHAVLRHHHRHHGGGPGEP